MKMRVLTASTSALILSSAMMLLAISGSGHAMQFTVTNPADDDQAALVRVSIPVPAGQVVEAPASLPVTDGRERIDAQAHVITRHPDGSVRRMMLSVPVQIPADTQVEYTIEVDAADPADTHTDQPAERIETDAYTVLASAGRLQLLDDHGQVIGRVEPFGPEAGGDFALTVLDAGPHFTWLRYDEAGEQWSRQVDVQVSHLGEIMLTHRILAHPVGDHWTPDFGWTLIAPGAQAIDVPDQTVTMLGRDPASRFTDESNTHLVAQLALSDGTVASIANPLALRQNRGTFEVTADEGVLSLRSARNEPVDDIESEGLMIQEGQWRFSELIIAPVQRETLATRLDAPVYGHADWRLYDAVYGTGEPLAVEHPVLCDSVEKMVFALQDMQMKGDDLGSMPRTWGPERTSKDYTSLVRLNHSLYVWEDWFRSGDPRLRRVAHDWCRNYHDLGMYWGPNPEFYGGCRQGNSWRDRPGHGPGTFNPRFPHVTGSSNKGWSNFYLMFEETGDPRYRYAAETASDWSVEHQQARNHTREIGVVADESKLYEYTAEQRYLDNAIRIWGTLHEAQGEDLLFTESGRPAVGCHLYIGSDNAVGRRHPFVKPYMVQYATNALPYLLKLTPEDERLRDTIIALNDWMVDNQQPAAGWGYPHPDTAGLKWNMEYVHGIMLAHEVEPKEEYLEAAARNLRPKVQLAELYGWPANGIIPWETLAGLNRDEQQELYELASDRDPMRDYEDGRVRFTRSPDTTVYFQVVLRDYLKHRSEESLFESDELLDRIKRLPTALDPTVSLPESLAMDEDDAATVSLTVDFKAPLPVDASAEVADLPEGITAEPAAVKWSVERGQTSSPVIQLLGTVDEQASLQIHWQIGEGWQGVEEIIIEPGRGF